MCCCTILATLSFGHTHIIYICIFFQLPSVTVQLRFYSFHTILNEFVPLSIGIVDSFFLPRLHLLLLSFEGLHYRKHTHTHPHTESEDCPSPFTLQLFKPTIATLVVVEMEVELSRYHTHTHTHIYIYMHINTYICIVHTHTPTNGIGVLFCSYWFCLSISAYR